jgi:hypothetical protein
VTRAGPATTDQSDTPAGTGETGLTGEGADLPPGVTVVPETFQLVDYDAPTIAGIVASLARRIRLPTGLPVRVEVDETTPLGRSRLTSVDPAVLSVESGALEDPHRPRQLSERAAATVLGRLLLQLQDRRDPAFGAPPEGTKLSAAESTTWDVYAMGRLARLGQAVRRPRWQYHFRVRHGFSDATDAVFDQIWDAHGLTWADLTRLSETATVKPPGD